MRRTRTGILLLLPLLAGCGLLFGPKPDRTRTYLLTPIDAERSAPDNALSVGVNPVRLPSYLDGFDLITRVGANELRPSPLDRWAEPLNDGFRRALGENLAILLKTDRVLVSTWYGKLGPDFAVTVQVGRFEPSTDGTATLTATWAVRRGAERKMIAARAARYQRSIAGSSATAAVAALSGCVEDLSRDIAAAIERARTE